MNVIPDTATIPIPCPNCGKKTETSIGWLKANKQMACMCGAVVDIDAEKLVTGIAKANDEFEKLRKGLGKLFKS